MKMNRFVGSFIGFVVAFGTSALMFAATLAQA